MIRKKKGKEINGINNEIKELLEVFHSHFQNLHTLLPSRPQRLRQFQQTATPHELGVMIIHKKLTRGAKSLFCQSHEARSLPERSFHCFSEERGSLVRVSGGDARMEESSRVREKGSGRRGRSRKEKARRLITTTNLSLVDHSKSTDSTVDGVDVAIDECEAFEVGDKLFHAFL